METEVVRGCSGLIISLLFGLHEGKGDAGRETASCCLKYDGGRSMAKSSLS